MSDFVAPTLHRLTLHDGQFVDIRAELNHGDTEDMNERIWPAGGFQRRMVRTAPLLAYVVGWSLTKPDPETQTAVPVPYAPDMDEQARLDTIRALSQDRALEIYEALDTYLEVRAKAQAQEKKRRTTAPANGETSRSPSAPAGESNGSAPSVSMITTTS